MSDPVVPVRETAATSESARVRRFSFLVSLVVVVVVACTWAWRGHHDPSLLAFGADGPSPRDQYPWEVADPGAVAWSGDTMSGPAGASVLRLDAADRPAEPLAMTGLSPGAEVMVYITDGTPPSNGLAYWPSYLGRLNPTLPPVLPDSEKDLVLWFSADTAWTAELAPLDAIPLSDHASGQGRITYLHHVGPGGPHLLSMACRALHDSVSSSTDVLLVGYTSAAGFESLADVRCPGEITLRLEDVPTVLEVVGSPSTEWTLTLSQDALSAPAPSPGG